MENKTLTMKLIRIPKFIAFIGILSFFTISSAKTQISNDYPNRFSLKILSSIAPELTPKSGENFEIVYAILEGLFENFSDTNLKDIRVIGKRTISISSGAIGSYTHIVWTHLEVCNKKDKTSSRENFCIKQLIKKPLLSLFLNKSFIILKNTLIETDGDLESLLADTRKLMIQFTTKTSKNSHDKQ